MMRSGAGALSINVTLGMVSLCLTLGVAEAILRMVYIPPPAVMEVPLRKTEFYQTDPILGWRPRSLIQGLHHIQGSFASTFHTNARGLRGTRDYSLEKGRALRMVVLGDSFTWGWGVNDEEVYTARLSSLFPQMEIINMGVTAYGSKQELEYFRTEGVKYQPDIVLLAFCLNDIESSSATKSTKSSSDGETINWKSWIAEHVYIYRFVIDRINTNKTMINLLVQVGLKGELRGYEALDVNVRPALRQYSDDYMKQWETTKSYLRAMRDLVRSQRGRFVLVLIPSLQTVEPTAFAHTIAYTKYEPEDFDLDKPYRLIEEFAKSEDMEVLNPVSAFRGVGAQGTKLYLTNDMHFSAAGHDLFAREIYTYLRVQGGREIASGGLSN